MLARLSRWFLVALLVVGAYFAYVGCVLVPAARPVVMEFLARLDRKNLPEAMQLVSSSEPGSINLTELESLMVRRGYLMRGIDNFKIRGFDVSNLSQLVISGIVIYRSGETGWGQFNLVKAENTWKLRGFDVSCSALQERQGTDARALCDRFLAALKSGQADQAARTLHPKLLESIGSGHLKEIAQKVSSRITGFTVDDAHAQLEDPTFVFVGAEAFRWRDPGKFSVRVQRVDDILWVTRFELE